MNLCTCNQCGSVFIDTNPSKDSINYPEKEVAKFTKLISILERLKDEDGEIFTGCPDCETDNYLVDNINANAGGNAKLISEIIGDFVK